MSTVATPRRVSTGNVSWGRLLCTGTKETINNRTVEFTDTEITIGRKDKCHLAYPGNMTISSVHCKISIEYGAAGVQARIEDTSSNGTYVNGQHLGKHKSCQLSQNDEVRLLSNDAMNDHYGDFVYMFQARPAQLRAPCLRTWLSWRCCLRSQDRTHELPEAVLDQLFPERVRVPPPALLPQESTVADELPARDSRSDQPNVDVGMSMRILANPSARRAAPP
jgi:hypothetical protein